MKQKLFFAGLFSAGLFGFVFQTPLVIAETVVSADQDLAAHYRFYLEEVKPILAEHCYECHADDPDDIAGNLVLTSHAALVHGGDSGAAIDGEDPAKSVLLQAVNYDVYEMPPDGKLSDSQIQTLTRWVEIGAPFPPSEEIDFVPPTHSSVPQVNDETKRWWSFQKVVRPEPPVVEMKEWLRNPIDYFILRKLESAGLTPAPPASRRQLIRRAYYDLVGLPPTPEQVAAFVSDDSPQAYANLIDELLASPHYGEKWGRHWLDLVRYAETNSFERDAAKPFVWRYRDYVIRAFNDDKPYDQFLTEQLAGDELPTPTADALIATGYYRLGAWDDEPADRLQAKFDELDDIVGTTSKTVLGLTVDCARCHDHKIDPIPQSDYYSMVSFFENIRRYGVRSGESVEAASIRKIPGEATPEEREQYEAKVRRLRKKIERIEAIAKPDFEPVEHEEYQYEMNRERLLRKRIGSVLTQHQFDTFHRARRELQRLVETPPGTLPVLCVTEEGSDPPVSYIRIRGNANVTGDEVAPSFLSVLSPPEPQITMPAHQSSTGRRLALAKWLSSDENPLTARVMVNRLWQYHFGRGIVRTSSDFGFQGAAPTHPELLDWLASEFVDHRWSIKAMHRAIMLSHAYQMSSAFNQDAYDADPENDLFWRFDVRRLTAEEIRDSILAVNGSLNLEQMFGPSIFPIQPKEVLAGQSVPGQGWGDSSESERRRRSIYIHVKRSLPVPILSTNDSADTDNTCPVRFITTQPTQALGMMNSDFTNGQAHALARSVTSEHTELRDRVAEVIARVTQRTANEVEIDRAVSMCELLVTEESMTAEESFEAFCLLALNLNEFVYVD
ncbi:PSD1 and planctomycete cytochrome C domain-containing protein [Rhodopirellula sp. SWK7]|uniref:PSD1 and planctomycete cytochrome C domain-containing protein n=1 Tax=Rhodopirellula sp. SWK7 TaxID=595460 RepID=UPI0002BD5B55|nr:PSD1 and planctomycete cytochrome C domain-containing protein [Rhodopirellula sp. SWK7]EMI46878.1 planctomycete cytochrome C domain protein [Rhodopirellula sp. SWK7]